METVHKTMIVAKCPQGATDVYEAEFHTGDRVILVEKILFEIARVTEKAIYQENLTQDLADRIGCKVVTRGRHGVFATECTAKGA